jgi:hypothetical protein
MTSIFLAWALLLEFSNNKGGVSMSRFFAFSALIFLALSSNAGFAGTLCSISQDLNDKTHYVVELDGAVSSPGSDIRTAVNLVRSYNSQGVCSKVSESVPKEMADSCTGWMCSGGVVCMLPCNCDGLNCSM